MCRAKVLVGMYFEGLTTATCIVGALHAMSIGANDGANVLGVTVGGGSLSMRTATWYMVVFELIGAFSVGHELTRSSQKTYIDIDAFEGDEMLLVLGILATMIGSSFIIFLFSYWRLPISTTQVTGTSLMIMALINEGRGGGISSKMQNIALSWVVSPLVGGVLSFILSNLLSRYILRPGFSEWRARKFMPIMFGIALFIFPMYIGFAMFGTGNETTSLLIILISLGLMLLAMVITHFLVYDWLVELSFRISPLIEKSSLIVSTHVLKYGSSEDLIRKADRLGAERIFCILQLISAAFFSLSHGANDVANTAAPLSILIQVAQSGKANEDELGDVEIWVPFVYGIFIALGIILFSSRVTHTMAESITKLTPSGGFVVLLSAAMALLINNLIQIPISTTQVIVGSIAGIGMGNSATERVKWKTLQVIFLGWIVCVLMSVVLVVAIDCMLVGFSVLI